MDTVRPQRESAHAPGWNWITSQGVYLWWDGERYTSRAEWDGTSWDIQALLGPPPVQVPRPQASHLAKIAMVGLITAGCVTLAVGATRVEERVCDYGGKTYTDASGAWLPWFVLAFLATLGVAVVWRRWAPGVRWIKAMAILGVVAAAVTCPVTHFFLAGAECGL